MTEKTNTYAVRLPVETIEELKKRLKKEGKTARELLTEYANGVNTSNIKKKEDGISVNTEIEFLKGQMKVLRTRCKPGAEENFDRGIYGLISIVPVGNEYPNEEKSETLKDILNMGRLFGMNETEFFEALADAMNAGRVAVEGGKIVGVPELELGAYFDKCHELNLKPQETLDKLTRAMR